MNHKEETQPCEDEVAPRPVYYAVIDADGDLVSCDDTGATFFERYERAVEIARETAQNLTAFIPPITVITVTPVIAFKTAVVQRTRDLTVPLNG